MTPISTLSGQEKTCASARNGQVHGTGCTAITICAKIDVVRTWVVTIILYNRRIGQPQA